MKRTVAALTTLSFTFFLISTALALIAFVPTKALATEVGVGTWSELCEALQADGNNITLTADVTYGEGDGTNAGTALVVPIGTTVTLDLNGHIVDRGLSEAITGGSVFDVSGNLTISDGNPAATHETAPITYTDPLNAEKSITVNGGIITGGFDAVRKLDDNKYSCGGGVLVRKGGSFSMTGGSICKNAAGSSWTAASGIGTTGAATLSLSGTATVCGNDHVGVYMHDGTITMSDNASICGNIDAGIMLRGDSVRVDMSGHASITDNNGSGIYNNTVGSHHVSMSDYATVSGNANHNNSGGGVGLTGISSTNRATLTMTGHATISDNTANYRGGGGLITANSVITMSDEASIKNNSTMDADNEAAGGGIFADSNCSITLSDSASITGNSAHSTYRYSYSPWAGCGGGIFAHSTCSITLSGNASVTGNSASNVYNTTRGGGGIALYGTLNVSGSPVVSGNTMNGATSNVDNYYKGEAYDDAGMITVSGALTEGASIGITTSHTPTEDTPRAFTTGFATNNPQASPAAFFRADNPAYKVTLNDEGEAQLELAEAYNLWIAGTQVTEANCSDVFYDGTVSFDPVDNVLTLSGYDTGTDPGMHPENTSNTYYSQKYVLYAAISDLIIKVVDDSTIRGAGTLPAGTREAWVAFFGGKTEIQIDEGVTLDFVGGTADCSDNWRAQCGMDMRNGVTISGKGTMNITGSTSSYQAILARGAWTIDGPDVVITAGTAKDSNGCYCMYDSRVTVNSGTLTLDATKQYSYRMSSSETVTAGDGLAVYMGSGPDDLEKQPGQSCNASGQGYLKVCEPFTYDLWIAGTQVTKSNLGSLADLPGVTVATGGSISFNPKANKLVLDNVSIVNTCILEKWENRYLSGIYTELPLSIEVKGTCSVTGRENWSQSYGICANGNDYDTGENYPLAITLQDGAALTSQGSAFTNGNYTCGICSSGDLSIAGSGTLNALGADVSGYGVHSVGIWSSSGSITLDDTPVVTATGGTVETGYESIGVLLAEYSSSKTRGLTVNGGVLTATSMGGGCMRSYGVYAKNGVVNVTNGELVASGGPVSQSSSYSYGIGSNDIKIAGGKVIAYTTATEAANMAALSVAPSQLYVTTAYASTDSDGSNCVPYVAADNAAYNWFSTEPVKPNPPDGGDDPATDPATQMGADGTPLGEGASAEAADAALAAWTSEADPAGTVFGKLLLGLKGGKAKKTSVKITWNKVSGAKSYAVYGNACGKKNAYVKLATFGASAKSATFKKVAGKKVKKGTYYKFVVVALSAAGGKGNVVSTSKTVHVATAGGKVGNDKAVKAAARKGKLALKRGKSFKLKAKAVPQSKKLKVKRHRKVAYESSNPKVASVNKKGVVKGLAKGTAYVYAYAQDGVAAKVKVTVK